MEITLDRLIIQKYDDLILDVLDHKYTHYTLYGGRGSTKSSFISIAIVLLITQNPNAHAVIFRKVANTMRNTVYSQMSFAISALNLDPYFKKTVSPMEITYKPTGQKILFQGVDEPEKKKSIKAPFGYFGITWFEELDQYHGREEIRKTLQATMRGEGGMFWNFESFNPPISAINWANKDLLISRNDRITVKTNYLDVPREWLSDQFFEEADYLRQTNERAYLNEYMGEATGTGSNVFENLKIETITDEQLKSFDRCLSGVDWGFYPDPWAYVRCFFHSGSRKLFIFDEAKAYKASNADTAKTIKIRKIPPSEAITCDGADPKSVMDYRHEGLPAVSASKPPGSVDYSMKWLATLNKIVIDGSRCPNTMQEFMAYEYERNKNGDVISGYPDKDDHFIAAVRYATNRLWLRNG